MHLRALALPFFDGGENTAEQIGVQTTAQTAVRANYDEANRLRFALDHERMFEIRIGFAQVANDVANTLRVGASSAHALLRFAHLARGHHLHGLGDLLSIFDTRDLNTYFFCTGHCGVAKVLPGVSCLVRAGRGELFADLFKTGDVFVGMQRALVNAIDHTFV